MKINPHRRVFDYNVDLVKNQEESKKREQKLRIERR